jgi:Gluconate 2-dehydrogenase subunit 3
MDRRTTIKWVIAAGAAWPMLGRGDGGNALAGGAVAPHGYGTDPNLTADYKPGEIWPLALTALQRRLAGILADIIIPADDRSPSASAVGVVDFIDEWLSAPYPRHRRDRTTVLDGFGWLDAEAARRSRKMFADLTAPEQRNVCDDICDPARATPARSDAARFFAFYRDLASGAFYSTPAGRKDLEFIGNVPLKQFVGPPPELLKALGLG